MEDNVQLVIFTHLDCPSCGNKDIKQYDAPGIPYGDYIHDEVKLTCNCGNKYNCKPVFGVSTDWKGFDNDNGHDSKSKFRTKNENGDNDGEGRDDESGNSQERAKPQKHSL